MNCHEVTELLQRGLTSAYVCELVGKNRLRLMTPFLYPDGDNIDLYIEMRDERFVLTDLGEVMAYLTDTGLTFRQAHRRNVILNEILATLGVESLNSELCVRLDRIDEDFVSQLSRLTQAAVQALDLLFTTRTTHLATFKNDVETYWIERKMLYEKGVAIEGSSGEIYTIDFMLPRQRPALVAALSTVTAGYANNLTSKTVRQWADIQGIDGRFNYISLIDDSSSVWRPEWINQIGQYSHTVFWEERQRLDKILLEGEHH